MILQTCLLNCGQSGASVEKRLPQTKHWTRPSLRPTATLLGRLVVVRLVVVCLVVVSLVVVLFVVVLLVVVVVARVVVGLVVVTTLACFRFNFTLFRLSIISSIAVYIYSIEITWHALVSMLSLPLRLAIG